MPGPKASVAAYVDKIQRPAMKITTYRLIEDAEGWELTGGRLEKELRYPADAESVQTVKPLVGFLVQYVGGELRIYRAGETVPAEIKIYPRSALPPLNRLGAL